MTRPSSFDGDLHWDLTALVDPGVGGLAPLTADRVDDLVRDAQAGVLDGEGRAVLDRAAEHEMLSGYLGLARSSATRLDPTRWRTAAAASPRRVGLDALLSQRELLGATFSFEGRIVQLGALISEVFEAEPSRAFALQVAGNAELRLQRERTLRQWHEFLLASDGGGRDAVLSGERLAKGVWDSVAPVCARASAWSRDGVRRPTDRSRTEAGLEPLALGSAVEAVCQFAAERRRGGFDRFAPTALLDGWVDTTTSPGKPPGTWTRRGVGGCHPFASVVWRGRYENVFGLVHEVAHLCDFERRGHRVGRVGRRGMEGFATAIETDFARWFDDRCCQGVSLRRHAVASLIDSFQRARVLMEVRDAVTAAADLGVDGMDAIWRAAHLSVYGSALELDGYDAMWVLHPEAVVDPQRAIDWMIACGYALASLAADLEWDRWWDPDQGFDSREALDAGVLGSLAQLAPALTEMCDAVDSGERGAR